MNNELSLQDVCSDIRSNIEIIIVTNDFEDISDYNNFAISEKVQNQQGNKFDLVSIIGTCEFLKLINGEQKTYWKGCARCRHGGMFRKYFYQENIGNSKRTIKTSE